ncbi:MAG: YbaK/EbsC family protein [Pelosinus sp.]|nr:YbaK/EbsC family protein [Pelosinus sp.]
MSIDRVKTYFRQFGLEDRVLELADSSATVELAAEALQCEPQRIAKTLSFHVGEGVVLVVAAGDAKIDNRKYKEYFGVKAKMLGFDEAESLIGHAVGGVCPFAVNDGVKIYLDVSLQRFETVYPAGGSASSAIKLTIRELEKYSSFLQWIDVCKGWNE